NFKVLGAKNIRVEQIDGLEFIKGITNKYDWIYLDPSRRMVNSKKVFMLSECIPNVIPHLELLLTKSKHVLIKTSPLLDISIGLNKLGKVKELHIVAVNNEVKELLWVIQEGHSDKVKVKTINFKKGIEDTYNFVWTEEKRTTPTYGAPQKFLYEPNAAILKGGAFKQITRDLKVEKLDEHSHLYTSHELVAFPGRSFRIMKVFDCNKKELKHLSGTKANVTVRNFPESVATIRKKYKIKDGGDAYLFFTTINKSELKVINCTKIQTTFR
ncbi:MAG: class I SAM-dependent methyltransferase, partial [Maribacter sp.]|nr:class I SAM-dependent methyltransferase [Maribacter sp.]